MSATESSDPEAAWKAFWQDLPDLTSEEVVARLSVLPEPTDLTPFNDHAALDEVRYMAARAAEWQTALVECVKSACWEGESITDIAAAAGVTRQTIYRWRDEAPASIGTASSLDAGLRVLIDMDLGPATTPDLVAALQSQSVVIKGQRIYRGLRAASGGMHDLGESDKTVLRVASYVAAIVAKYGDQTYPRLARPSFGDN